MGGSHNPFQQQRLPTTKLHDWHWRDMPGGIGPETTSTAPSDPTSTKIERYLAAASVPALTSQ